MSGERALGVVGVAWALAAITAPPLVAQSCATAGYLCLAAAERPVVARWPDGTRSLRILLPAPAHEAPSRALRYQQAAARGIMAWHGQPLELLVFERGDPEQMDIVVEWESQLSDGRIGETHLIAGVDGDATVFEVVRFVLATRPPETAIMAAREAAAEEAGLDPEAEPPPLPPDVLDQLSLETVETTAVHEMGHALGLPHSDSPADVMYPEHSGARVSRRDVETVRALYALPAGTRLR